MGKKEVIGSWYNSGFHGHYRSKPRLDFINEYRNTARPLPPKVFIKRAQDIGTKHLFSHHDNKHSFQNDALYFEQGLGRRRFRNKQTKWDPTMLSWMPAKDEWTHSGPVNSMYKITYRGVPPQQIKQKITTRPITSFDLESPTTTYRYSHGRDNPHAVTLTAHNSTGANGGSGSATISATDNDVIVASQTSVTNRKKRSTLDGGRDSVASCMTWHTPRPPSSAPRMAGRPHVPPATQVLQPPKTSYSSLSTTAAPPTTTAHHSVHFDSKSLSGGDQSVVAPPDSASVKVRVGSPVSIATAPAELVTE